MESFTGVDEGQLLKSLKAGNQSAFTIIYNTFWERLYLTAYLRIKDQSGAEEVVQEVFMKLWSKRESLNIQNLTSYLAAMTRYGTYRYLARESKMKEREKIWALSKNPQNTVSLNLEDKLLLEFIRDLSNELPARCRLVFLKNKLEDKSLKDVANAMNISQKTAEAHLTKALRFIRNRTQNHIGIIILVVALILVL